MGCITSIPLIPAYILIAFVANTESSTINTKYNMPAHSVIPKFNREVPTIDEINLGSKMEVLPLYTNIRGSEAIAGNTSLYLHLKFSISSESPSKAIRQKERIAESYLIILLQRLPHLSSLRKIVA